jgi:hypothetical protein
MEVKLAKECTHAISLRPFLNSLDNREPSRFASSSLLEHQTSKFVVIASRRPYEAHSMPDMGKLRPGRTPVQLSAHAH